MKNEQQNPSRERQPGRESNAPRQEPGRNANRPAQDKKEFNR